MQQQCPHCGRLGERHKSAYKSAPPPSWAAPHADGSRCCGHPTCASPVEARRAGGRYYDGQRWVCVGCAAAAATETETCNASRTRVRNPAVSRLYAATLCGRLVWAARTDPGLITCRDCRALLEAVTP